MRTDILKILKSNEEKEQSPYRVYIEEYCIHCERWNNEKPEFTKDEWNATKEEIMQCATVRLSLKDLDFNILVEEANDML